MIYKIFIVFVFLFVLVVFYGKQLWQKGFDINSGLKLISILGSIAILVILVISYALSREKLNKYKTINNL